MDLIISIKVTPSSGKYLWTLDKNGNLKVYLKSSPEKGLANKELIKELSKTLKIPQDQITILLGTTSRHKKIKIKTTLSQEQLLHVLGIEKNLSLI